MQKFKLISIILLCYIFCLLTLTIIPSINNPRVDLNLNSSSEESWARLVIDNKIDQPKFSIINDEIYVVGTIVNPDDDIFIAKYNTNGTRLWQVIWGGLNYETLLWHGFDSFNDLYLIGRYDTSHSEGFLIIMKYNSSNGDLLWAYTFEKYRTLYNCPSAIDFNNSLYITVVNSELGELG